MARPSKYDWKNIRLDLEAGLSHEYVHKKYEVPYDAINKNLKRNPLQVSQEADAVIKGFDEVSQQVSQLKDKQPELAKRTMDIVAEKHPEFKKAMVALSSKLFNRMLQLAPEAEARDIPNLAKGMQTVTDTLGVTQRHAPKTEINTQNNQQTNIVMEIE
ncbi:MAG: hypothetical protein U9O83_01160 [Campylobacterota bacterium]|nr:hypothetical protein [Campylobacterota bacterium]